MSSESSTADDARGHSHGQVAAAGALAVGEAADSIPTPETGEPPEEGLIEVPLAQIQQVREAWPRRELDLDRVRLFVGIIREDPARLPPIEVIRYGEVWLLVDGWHRLQARRELGQDVVPVRVLEVPDGEDPLFFAFQVGVESCSASAKPLTSREKRWAVGRWLDAHPELSDREIARKVGISNSTVSAIRRPIGERERKEIPTTSPEFRSLMIGMGIHKARGAMLGRFAAALKLGTGGYLRPVPTRRLAEEFAEAVGQLTSGARDEADVQEKISSALEEFASAAADRLRSSVRIAHPDEPKEASSLGGDSS